MWTRIVPAMVLTGTLAIAVCMVNVMRARPSRPVAHPAPTSIPRSKSPVQYHVPVKPVALVRPESLPERAISPLPASLATAGPLRLVDSATIPLATVSSRPSLRAMAPPAGNDFPVAAVALSQPAATDNTTHSPMPSYPPQYTAPPPVHRESLPDRGLTARAIGMYRTGKEGYFFKPTEYSAFDLTGMEYGIGLRKDMSVNTIAGVSVRALDYTVEGTGYADNRKNDISGWYTEADISTSMRVPFLGNAPFLLEASLGMGSLKTDGSGTYRDLAWREKKHDSSLYRMAATARTSERTTNYFSLETEIGVELTRISSDAYTAMWGPSALEFAVDKKTSTSVSVPIRFTAWEDYVFPWGTGIFRLMLGARYDFGNGGTAAYSFNASSGGMASPNMRMRTLDLQYDPRGGEWEAGVGLDLWTNRGWYCRADYKARFSGSLNQINENMFSLELGACF